MSMSAPTHSRRAARGTAGATEFPEIVPPMPATMERQLSGFDVRKVTVLSKADWERIQYRLNKKQIEAEKIRKAQEDKQRLHALSLERVKNWSNTVYGQRQRKLEERQMRLEREEEERKKIDVEEALIQAEKRKLAIEKAKLQQYFQTDRVKNFHSALLMTEVLKEREAQIELKRLREQMVEKESLEKLRKEMEETIRIDNEEKGRARDARMKTVAFQIEQIKEHERENVRLKEEEMVEADELRRLAEEFAEEERRKEEQRRQLAAQRASDNRRQIADIEMMKQVDRIQQEEEDEECRLFAAAKRKMMRLRAEKEKQMRDEKQAELQVIQDKLTAQMKRKVSDEDGRIAAAQKEKEEKLAAEEAEKAERRAKMLESINEHRIEQMKLNKERHEKAKCEEVELLKMRMETDILHAWNESEKLRKKHEEAKIFASVYLDQAEERKQMEKLKREHDEEQFRRDRELDDIQEAQFQAYAQEVIEHCEKRGRNTYPLRKVAMQVVPGRQVQRPDYLVADQSCAELPHFQTCSTENTKQTINGKTDSSKRLGFCM